MEKFNCNDRNISGSYLQMQHCDLALLEAERKYVIACPILGSYSLADLTNFHERDGKNFFLMDQFVNSAGSFMLCKGCRAPLKRP